MCSLKAPAPWLLLFIPALTEIFYYPACPSSQAMAVHYGPAQGWPCLSPTLVPSFLPHKVSVTPVTGLASLLHLHPDAKVVMSQPAAALGRGKGSRNHGEGLA